MKSKKFVYIGDSVPEPGPAFLKNLQSAILHALRRRGVLTDAQAEVCTLSIHDHEAESR